MAEEAGENIKVVLLGDSGVGKTCIINRYTEDKFDESSTPTQGVSYSQRILDIDNKNIILDLWDTAGQEKYRSLGRRFYKNAYIVCLVYDISSAQTFENLKNIWFEELKEFGEKYYILAVVGNKSDKYEKEEVKNEIAEEFAESIKASFMLTSAKSGDNIELLFDTLIRRYLGPKFIKKVEEMKKDKGQLEKVTNSREKQKNKKSKCC